MGLLATLLPALIPAVSDGLRGIIVRVTGGAGAKPATVGEAIQLMQADTDRLKALAQLDTPVGTIYTWVASARALERPALATLILAAYVAAMLLKEPPETIAALGQYAAMVTFYLFGDRGYTALKGAR
jgi:hypothetical protein